MSDYEIISITIDRPTLAKVETLVQRTKAERPASAVTRSEIIRLLLMEALAAKN